MTARESKSTILFSWATYLLTIFVIVWGAFVRATHSGAGCGKHWPMCNGEVLPLNSSIETLIEFTHRTTSGLSAIAVLFLWYWLRRSSDNISLRKVSVAALSFMGIEVLVGAFLVLFGWVKNDTSGIRAVVIALHLVNSFLLLASLNILVVISQRGYSLYRSACARRSLALLGLFLLVGSFGAVTALGDTLFPATSFTEGFQQDFSSNSHFLLQLRVLHPILAILVTYFLVQFSNEALGDPLRRSLAVGLLMSTALQVSVGIFAITLLAPIYLQILHLVGAIAVWHFLVQLIIATEE